MQKPHVEEEVDPGKGEGDGADLPVQARSFSTKEFVASHEESEDVDEGVKEENNWKLGSPPLDVLELAPDWLKFPVEKEKNHSRYIEQKKKPSEGWVVCIQPL